MKAIGKYFRDHGLYTMIANNSIHTNPPLCITEDAARRGLRDHRRARSTSPTRRSRASRMARPARLMAVDVAVLGARPIDLAPPPRAAARLPDGPGPPPHRLGGRQGDRRRRVAVRLVPWHRHRRRLARRPSTSAVRDRLKLPHTWDIALEFLRPDANGLTTLERLFGAALFTLRNAVDRVRPRFAARPGARHRARPCPASLERALVPIIVASQTIPIIAIAPLIVIGLKADWFGVAIVADLPDVLPGDHRGPARPACATIRERSS